MLRYHIPKFIGMFSKEFDIVSRRKLAKGVTVLMFFCPGVLRFVVIQDARL